MSISNNKNIYEIPASERPDYDPTGPSPDYSGLNPYGEFNPNQEIPNVSSIEEQDPENSGNPDDLLGELDKNINPENQQPIAKKEEDSSKAGEEKEISMTSDNKEQLVEQEANERVKNSRYFSLLQNLKEAGWLDEKQFTEIQKKLTTISKDEEQQTVEMFVEENVKEGKSKEQALAEIKGEKIVNNNNFKDSDFFKDAKESLGTEIEIGEEGARDLDVMLANSYTSIPNYNDKSENKQRDMMSAMGTVKSDILLEKDDRFKQQNAELIKKIEEAKNPIKKYTALTELHELSLIKNGELASKGKESIRTQASKKDLLDRDEELMKKYKEIVASNITAEQKAKEIEALKKQAQELITKGKEIEDNKKAQVESLQGGKGLDSMQNNADKIMEDPLAL